MQAQLLRIQVLILRAQQIDIAACGLFGRLFSAPAGKRNLLGIQGQIFCKTGQGDRRCLLQQRAGDALRSQLLCDLFIQLPLCGIGNNDLRTGAGDQLVLRRRFCKGPCVDCLRQLWFIDRAVKQPPVVFPDVLRVMDGKFISCTVTAALLYQSSGYGIRLSSGQNTITCPIEPQPFRLQRPAA